MNTQTIALQLPTATATAIANDTVAPGDVLVIRTHDFTGWWIRFGAALLGKPNLHNHVAIVTQIGEDGTPMGVEATANGVELNDLSGYLADRWTITNKDQPKTAEQRAAIVKAANYMIGTPYDWDAIVVDGLEALRVAHVRMTRYGIVKPKRVVCSALADLVYTECGIPCPGDGRFTTPADWSEFIALRDWEK